jgi:CheY-like chemotaxis protein
VAERANAKARGAFDDALPRLAPGSISVAADAIQAHPEAVEMAALVPYDSVILDFQTPEINGYEGAREIARQTL